VSADQPAVPALRIVRGDPGAEEIAAVVAVLASASAGGPAQPQEGAVSHWAAPGRLMRTAVEPTGWWASALPR
jgi:hypothetical protein